MVYVGVMSPEENMIVILQNVLMFIYSSIGYLMLLPFYQVVYHVLYCTVLYCTVAEDGCPGSLAGGG